MIQFESLWLLDILRARLGVATIFTTEHDGQLYLVYCILLHCGEPKKYLVTPISLELIQALKSKNLTFRDVLNPSKCYYVKINEDDSLHQEVVRYEDIPESDLPPEEYYDL